MTVINHHVPDAMLAAYAAGNLPYAFAVVVASHISLCNECRAAYEAHSAAGGVVLEDSVSGTLSRNFRDTVLSKLDDPYTSAPVYKRSGIYPAPVMKVMQGREPRWKTLGMGVCQDILSADEQGSVRLLYIPAGQAVPDHSHKGPELTLVLQGSFSDETGHFGTGDLEVADQELHHTPVADPDQACICLAATDAPLRFKAIIPRLLQPVFRI